ncbi:MAG: hypothetical protein ACLQNE_02060 [Thermoguttaceae bacterium]|jgi:hypothetical protein
MSMFENDQYQWRETYFVLFPSAKRPKLRAVEKKLSALNNRLTLANGVADEDGLLESITVLSPDDFAALDICYVGGEEVREQVKEMIKEIKTSDCRREDRKRLERLPEFDGRFDVYHFEQMTDLAGDDEVDEMLDPSTLLIVLDALTELTHGIAIDPASGAIL